MKTSSKPVVLIALCMLILAGVALYLRVMPQVEDAVAQGESLLYAWFEPYQHLPWLLPGVGFLGGLIASISPCILALLPLNLSYIGALESRSRREAVGHAACFALGMVIVLSLMGLVSSVAGALVIAYRGAVDIGVGLFACLMGLSLLNVLPIPFYNPMPILPVRYGPLFIGGAFALVSSPCSSPLLLSVLGMTGETGNPLLGVVTMACYALGYVFVLFWASVLTGWVKWIDRVKPHAGKVTMVGSVFLILIGIYYIYTGIVWFVAE